MLIDDVDLQLVLKHSHYPPDLPLIVVQDVYPVSHLEVLPVSLLLLIAFSLLPVIVKVARPLVTELHFHHEYIAVFDNELLQRHLQATLLD
jgi:hypothetical protein